MPSSADAQVSSLVVRRPKTVGLDDTLADVRDVMAEGGFHHVVVVDAGVVVGIVSDRDVLAALSPVAANERLAGTSDLATLRKRVHQVMSHRVVAVRPETPIADAVQLMLDHRIHALPVVDERRRPVGIVTSVDAMRWGLDLAAHARSFV